MKTTNAKLRFPGHLSKFIDEVKEVNFSGESVIDLFDFLENKYSNVKERVFEDGAKDQLRPYFNVFIGKKDIRSINGVFSVIPDGETVSILLARAGG